MAEPISAPIKHPDRLFIDGSWVAPSSNAKFDVIDSGTEELFVRVAEARDGACGNEGSPQLLVRAFGGLVLLRGASFRCHGAPDALVCDLRIAMLHYLHEDG